MSVLVTGATGFIGSHVCKELVRRGHQVVGLSFAGRTDNSSWLFDQGKFELVKGDIRSPSDVRGVFQGRGVSAVLHLAALIPGKGEVPDRAYFETNTLGSVGLLRAAVDNGVKTYVYGSTMSVYSDPPLYLPVDEDHPTQPSSAYGVSKLAGELYSNLYADKVGVVVLRYSGAYGRGERASDAVCRFIMQALANKPITVFGDGRQTSDFVSVEDAARATVDAWERDTRGVYNVGSGQETSVRELARKIKALSKSNSEIVFTGEATDRPFRFCLDVSKAHRELGYRPGSIDDGLSAYIRQFDEGRPDA